MKIIFPTHFYWIFDVPNFKEVLDYCDKQTNYSDTPSWASMCNIRTISLDINELFPIIEPSVTLFLDEMKEDVELLPTKEPWLNFYERGGHQEIHDHPSDIVSVMFLNDGKNFSEFFFYNRHGRDLNDAWRDSSKFSLHTTWSPEITAGQIIFFPGHMLHGVTQHDNDTIRKTLACNFTIK